MDRLSLEIKLFVCVVRVRWPQWETERKARTCAELGFCPRLLLLFVESLKMIRGEYIILSSVYKWMICTSNFYINCFTFFGGVL